MNDKDKKSNFKLPDFVSQDRENTDEQYDSIDQSKNHEKHQMQESINTFQPRRGFDYNPLEVIDRRSRYGDRSSVYKFFKSPYQTERQPIIPVRNNFSDSSISRSSNVLSSSRLSSSSLRKDVPVSVKLLDGRTVTVEAEKKSTIADVFRKIIDEHFASDKEENLRKYALYLDGKKIDNLKYVHEVRVTPGSSLELKEKIVESTGENTGSAPMSQVPKLTQPGTTTEPPYEKLCRMSSDSLACVNNFTIRNSFAKVHFLNDTDLRGLNLDKIIILSHKSVELYPEGTVCPPRKQGLNKPAIITMYKYGLKNHSNLQAYVEKFKRAVAVQKGHFIGYDLEEDSVSFQIEAIDG